AEVEDVAFVADAVGVHHVELSDAERRGYLVLDDLHADPLADDVFAFLQLADTTDVDAAGGVELQSAAARGGFGATEHHADLLADLVDENDRGLGLRDGASQLAERLAHQAGLQADVRITNVPFKFLL